MTETGAHPFFVPRENPPPAESGFERWGAVRSLPSSALKARWQLGVGVGPRYGRGSIGSQYKQGGMMKASGPHPYWGGAFLF